MNNNLPKDLDNFELNALFRVTIIMMKIDKDFKKELIENYIK